MASCKPVVKYSVYYYVNSMASTSETAVSAIQARLNAAAANTHSIEYYFGDQRIPTESASRTRTPILLNIRPTMKRPVGRPHTIRKPTSTPNLVDYSSSSDRNDEPEPNQKKLRKMYSTQQKKVLVIMRGIMVSATLPGTLMLTTATLFAGKQKLLVGLKTQIKGSTKVGGQGRKLSYPKEIEQKLVAWIFERWEIDCVPISTQIVRCKALPLITPVNPQFKASVGWVRKFMHRNDLVLRCRTHINQTLPKDLETKIAAFNVEVASIFDNGDYPLDYVFNMDETPVFLDLLPGKVIDKKGKKTINVRTTGSDKNRITATLCCAASGKMLPSFVIFKGKTIRPLKKVTVPTGVVCSTQSKAWMDEIRMLEWIEKIWAPYVGNCSNPALLSLDTFSGHLSKTDKDAFAKIGTEL